MFEMGAALGGGSARDSAVGVRGVIASLALLEGDDDALRIDLIRELESLKGAASAAQARLAVAFADSQEAAQWLGACRPANAAEESPPRSLWRGASRRIVDRGTSASPGRWSARCLARWRTPKQVE